MTFINYKTRPLPSHVFLDGKKVDRFGVVAVDDVAGYVETLVFDETRGRPFLKLDANNLSAPARRGRRRRRLA
jgi:hypothetical protein